MENRLKLEIMKELERRKDQYLKVESDDGVNQDQLNKKREILEDFLEQLGNYWEVA